MWWAVRLSKDLHPQVDLKVCFLKQACWITEYVGPESVAEVAQYKNEIMWKKAYLHVHKEEHWGTQITPWFGKSKNHHGSAVNPWKA